MKIGITERGDAGIDLSWVAKVNQVDGMILITKKITEMFVLNVLDLHKKGYKIIVHCTVTGFGGTELEPNVPSYIKQLDWLAYLINQGFPAERCVIRIDPIFPTTKGLKRVQDVIEYVHFMNHENPWEVTRFRISIVDEYKHVKDRYRAKGWEPIYGNAFGPNSTQIKMVADFLNQYTHTFELCAENELANRLMRAEVVGCISNKDLELMGLPVVAMPINPQKRTGCHCLSCKTELLTERKQCPNGCVYCFWKQ